MATPNLYEDNKGKVTKESGGSGGGGIETYELITLMSGGSGGNFIIKGATSDIGDMFILEQHIDDDIIKEPYIIDFVGSYIEFARLSYSAPDFPQYLYIKKETPTGLLVTTEEPD